MGLPGAEHILKPLQLDLGECACLQPLAQPQGEHQDVQCRVPLRQLDALLCSSERFDRAKQALFPLNRAQSVFTNVSELNYSYLGAVSFGMFQLVPEYTRSFRNTHNQILGLIFTMQCPFRVTPNRANQPVITRTKREQQLLCACCWYEEVRTATTKGTQTFQLGILDDGNMPGPMV